MIRMKLLATYVLMIGIALPVFARKIDYRLLKKMNGTKWELQAVHKPGFFKKWDTEIVSEKITFSGDRLLFDLADANYYCTFKLQHKNEFLLECLQPEEYIYKVRSLNYSEMIIDIYVKQKEGGYREWKSKRYRRLKS